MKTIVILFFATLFMYVPATQETITVKAEYNGFENDLYSFIDEEGNILDFEDVFAEVLDTYDLTDDAFIGETFKITYKTEVQTDDFNNEYDVYVIVALELIK